MERVGVACFKCHFAWYKVHRDDMVFSLWCKQRKEDPEFLALTDIDREAVSDFFVPGPWDTNIFALKDCGFKIYQELKLIKPAKMDAILQKQAPLKVSEGLFFFLMLPFLFK